MKERPDIWPGKPEKIGPNTFRYAGYIIEAIEEQIGRGEWNRRLRYRLIGPNGSSAVKELEDYGLVSMQDVVSFVEYERRRLWQEIKLVELLNASRKFTHGVTREDQKNQS